MGQDDWSLEYKPYTVIAGGLKVINSFGINGTKKFSSIEEAEAVIELFKERRIKYYTKYNYKLVPLQFAIQEYTSKYEATIVKLITI